MTHSDQSFTRRILFPAAACTLAGLLAACGGGSSDDGESVVSEAGEAAANAGAAVADAASDLAERAAGDDSRERHQNWTTSTPEGTVKLFGHAMADANYLDATSYLEPTSAAYEQLLESANIRAQHQANIDARNENFAGSTMAVRMLDLVLATRFQRGFETTVVSTDADHATVAVDFAHESDADVELKLQSVDGAWFILAGEELLQPSRGISTPQAPQGPPAPPAPRGERPAPPADTDVNPAG